MSRRERAIKRSFRADENGRSSFKKIYVGIIDRNEDGYENRISDNLKDMQKQLKDARNKTREYSRKISFKEDAAA